MCVDAQKAVWIKLTPKAAKENKQLWRKKIKIMYGSKIGIGTSRQVGENWDFRNKPSHLWVIDEKGSQDIT